MKKEKILVTGGTGYIGSHTTVELLNAGYEVEILDNLYNSKIEVLDKIAKITGVKPKFYEIDLKNYADVLKVFEDTKYDAVIHFAGLKAVGESVKKPLEYYENNIGGTINLLKAMAKTGVEKLIFSSSATVYGDQGVAKLDETMETGKGITNPYGRTKYMIEEILKDVAKANTDFDCCILRYFNPVGAHSSGIIGEDPNGIPNNLMPIVMKVYRGEIPELAIYGDDYNTEDGSCIRDYIHVVDLAKGHIAALKNLRAGAQIYNLGSGKGTSVFEIVNLFEKISGKDLPHKIAGRRDGDLAELIADPTLANTNLNWKTELTVEDAIKDTLNYLRSLE